MPHSRLSIVQGDITDQATDAIVNAANNSLLGGGGVDGAIHRAAGSKLLEECRTLGGCKTGDAKITGGYKLRAKHVIHTVGPVWQDGAHGENELLANCYRSCFSVAHKHNLKSIAFPSISTGVYRFPVELAARIALKEIHHELASNAAIGTITVVCFDKQTYETYTTAEREFKE
jgi:O-acetyl-ADP-ribose deacetylase (regulator of RNase III)